MNIERVDAPRCQIGESPLWSARDQAWYWVDISARRIWRHDGTSRYWECPEMVACLAQAADGSFIAGMERGLYRVFLDEAPLARTELLSCPPELGPGMRFNDGRCDRQGRFWSGTMLMDNPAARPDGYLYRFSVAQGLSAPVVDQLLVSNGLAWSPDGRTMYLSDSHMSSQQVWAFDYDIDSGMPGVRRLFVDMRQHPGRPDGAAVDVDGCYWTCANDAGLLLRFTPDGKLDRTISLPMAKPAMCSFGGPGLDTLMVTSISAGQATDDEWIGATLLLRPGVCGIAETAFQF